MAESSSFANARKFSSTGGGAASSTIGRFELRKVLGQGAQSVVWLAFDPRMEREVAIKLMRAGEGGSDDVAIKQWLQEARSVGRVSHPNIVPVFEADIQDRQPYLVFEYVAGNTLAQVIKQRGALPAAEAVSLMLDVLDAVAVAHAAGVVHRDLKPSNILVDAAGRARVMDFGIAARIKGDIDPGAGGTVGYLAPEAANGDQPATSMDIFSAGVILAELLMGRRLIDEPDPYRAVYRVAHEQLKLPDDLDASVDDRLRAIVMRALARDPKQRFASMRTFKSELEQWATPVAVSTSAATVPGGESAASKSATLEFLLRRMRHKSDFPALSDSVVRIQSMASSETESVHTVTNAILKDVALTNKLLRLVNSALYARGGGNVSTVSRAVTLVGFNGIRNMALSLVLLEHMQDKKQAEHLKEEFLRSLMAGSIASELCPAQRETEEAFIGSMFQNLGRLLVQYYFPEEAAQIRSLVQSKRGAVSESTAAMRVLGLTLQEIGLGVAKTWGLPMGIQRCMRLPEGEIPTSTPFDVGERLRWVSVVSNEVADTLLHSQAKDTDANIASITRKYSKVMGNMAGYIADATKTARTKMIDLAKAMDIRVVPGSAAAHLLRTPISSEEAAAQAAERESSLGAFELHATSTDLPSASDTAAIKARMVTATLAAGIQDITNAMVDDFKLPDILRMILETMYRAMDFQRVIFCMRDAKTETLTGRFGLGSGVEQHIKIFKIPLKTTALDLFAVICNKGADTMINDSSEARIMQNLPEWYRRAVNAPTFLVLPLQNKGVPFGMIYADKSIRGGMDLNDKQLAMLRTLRNQAVMAFRQSR